MSFQVAMKWRNVHTAMLKYQTQYGIVCLQELNGGNFIAWSNNIAKKKPLTFNVRDINMTIQSVDKVYVIRNS
jgi:hypothetical protein